MRSMRVWIALLAVWTAAGEATAAGLGPGLYDRSFEYDGRERTYILKVPNAYDGSEPTPLVLDFHGFGSNALEQSVVSGYSNLADEEGFLVAQPNGAANSWNGGICCGLAAREGLDSLGFARALAWHVSLDTNVDPSRIYGTGLSNGGALSHRLGCEAADFFAAIAPLAFGVPYGDFTECRPSRPVTVHLTMGLTDTLVPYALALPSFEHWRDVNGCAGEIPDRTAESGDSRCETYDRCEEGVEVTLCSVVASDLAGTPFEDLAGHVLYINPDFNLAREGWTHMSGFVTDPPPVLVPEPGTASLAGAAAAALLALRCRRPKGSGPVDAAGSRSTLRGRGAPAC